MEQKTKALEAIAALTEGMTLDQKRFFLSELSDGLRESANQAYREARDAKVKEAEANGTAFVCGRRGFTDGRREDYWTEHGCSYCGSMRPDTFMEKLEAGATVVPTDKVYKAYLKLDDRQPKFYFQHLSKPQMERFVELLVTKKMSIAHPGHFYVRPYFIP